MNADKKLKEKKERFTAKNAIAFATAFVNYGASRATAHQEEKKYKGSLRERVGKESPSRKATADQIAYAQGYGAFTPSPRLWRIGMKADLKTDMATNKNENRFFIATRGVRITFAQG